MRTMSLAVAVASAALALATAAPASAGRGDDAQRKSKNGRVEGSVGGAAVVIEYGRPNVNGREVWGALVPWGQVWRTGADEATTISFDRDVAIAGQPLAKGTYALFTIPGEKSWTIVFNRVAAQWGAFDYDAKQDALRVEVAARAHEPTETLTFALEGDTVVLRWERLEVPFAVRAAG
ncbi:MAG: DUF2911 domain-containing protein [Thermoanaerobaculia bacterium]|nr:MAG: DUF2911 domain-containing protein [Thermoanaerobaculia bacterium]